MSARLLLGASVSLNVVLWLRYATVKWRAEVDRDSAYRQGKRDGWFDAVRHLPIGSKPTSTNILN